jgi:hypothetical protein
MTALKIAALLLLASVAVPAWAQTPLPPSGGTLASDRAQLAACLRESGTAAASCIGAVAVACVRAANADRRGAEFGCARREEAVWRERLMEGLQATGRSLDSGRRSRLAALHVAWESYVAQKCAFYGATQREGWQLGRQAGCELREVANRAIELARGISPAPPRRPQAPPQIFR